MWEPQLNTYLLNTEGEEQESWRKMVLILEEPTHKCPVCLSLHPVEFTVGPHWPVTGGVMSGDL